MKNAVKTEPEDNTAAKPPFKFLRITDSHNYRLFVRISDIVGITSYTNGESEILTKQGQIFYSQSSEPPRILYDRMLKETMEGFRAIVYVDHKGYECFIRATSIIGMSRYYTNTKFGGTYIYIECKNLDENESGVKSYLTNNSTTPDIVLGRLQEFGLA